jgi:hypothetical protein
MSISSVGRKFLSRYMLAALGILSVVFMWSLVGGSPVRSIFPYALAVALVAWRHGLISGFGFAAFACFVAALGGAFPTQPQWLNDLVGEGLMTYLKLSAVVIGTSAGKRVGERLRQSDIAQ